MVKVTKSQVSKNEVQKKSSLTNATSAVSQKPKQSKSQVQQRRTKNGTVIAKSSGVNGSLLGGQNLNNTIVGQADLREQLELMQAQQRSLFTVDHQDILNQSQLYQSNIANQKQLLSPQF